MEYYNFRTITAVYCENCDDMEVVTTGKIIGRAHINLGKKLDDDFTFLNGIYVNKNFCYYVLFEIYAPNPSDEIICEKIDDFINIKVSLINEFMKEINPHAFFCKVTCK